MTYLCCDLRRRDDAARTHQQSTAGPFVPRINRDVARHGASGSSAHVLEHRSQPDASLILAEAVRLVGRGLKLTAHLPQAEAILQTCRDNLPIRCPTREPDIAVCSMRAPKFERPAPVVDILKALQKSIAENKSAPKQAAPSRSRKNKAA